MRIVAREVSPADVSNTEGVGVRVGAGVAVAVGVSAAEGEREREPERERERCLLLLMAVDAAEEGDGVCFGRRRRCELAALQLAGREDECWGGT